jgi:hypothetical protein
MFSNSLLPADDKTIRGSFLDEGPHCHHRAEAAGKGFLI